MQKLFALLDLITNRIGYLLIIAFSICAIAIALIAQYGFDMEPCPLCISQRIFIIGVGLASALALLLSRWRVAELGAQVLGTLLAIIGGCISARHVWIQSLPADQVPDCGPGLGYMFETRPLFDALSLLFTGDGNCADVYFTFLGLTIPAWTLVAFAGLVVFQLFLFIRTLRNKSVKQDG
ncbi:disulfide bond formation protein B [Agaribacterium haliotis]|uniref:disulfide bond formation protein B n=1 Tax=Agaribacterium haliotis TaxID=2013869 RepID=UPI000BB52CC9|nr:disulfide bond formation protein B [Agaribacterium haliotis]